MSEEDIHNSEWQNTHDLAVVTLFWKVGNVAQHSNEKKIVWDTMVNATEIQEKYLFQPKLHHAHTTLL